MTVIELGLVTDGDDQPPASGSSSPRVRADLRRMLAALVVLCCLFTVTGSARPTSHGTPRLWSMPFRSGVDSYTVTGDAVFLLTADGGTLSAYDLRTGALRWTNPAAEDASSVDWAAAGVLLMSSGDTTEEVEQPDGSVLSRQYSRDTVAIDAATGRQLWRQAGQLTGVAEDRAVLTESDATGNATRVIRVVGLRDGKVIFTPPMAGLENWTIETMPGGAPPDRLVTATADGFVRVFGLADGDLVASGRLPWQRRSDDEGNATSLTLSEHRLFLERFAAGASTVDAYDTETLRLLWQRKTTGSGYYSGCGPVLCRSDETGTTTGYDRDTGAPRWRFDGGQSGWPLSADRILFQEVSDSDLARQYVVDATTGRIVVDLGTASPVWNYPDGDAAYLLKPTREPAGRMSISRLDLRTGAARLLGVIDPVDLDCQAASGLLVCLTLDQRLAVTDTG